MLVLTWNVLHRVHAVNWQEPVIAAWPDETARCGSIADFIAAQHADIVCLQEVSGDQLAMLRDVVEGDIVATPYPRIPRWKRAQQPMRDVTEYLVTIGGALVSAEAFAEDPGKGFQCVRVGSLVVVNTHVTYGKTAEQLARLRDLDADVICGDFNADRAACSNALATYTAADAQGLPTRPRQQPSEKSQDIDHVFVRGHAVIRADVLDGDGRSDHNPVRVELRRA